MKFRNKNARMITATAALSLLLLPAASMAENPTTKVTGEAEGPGANVEINTDEDGNTTVRAEAGVKEPQSGSLVILDPTTRTFRLEGNDRVYVAPPTAPIQDMAGEDVTINFGDGSATLNGLKPGEKYDIEVDEDWIGDDTIEIERKDAGDLDLDGGVNIDID